MKIPSIKLSFGEDENEEIKSRIDEILSSGFLTLGKYCNEFENKFSGYVGTKYGIATNSGTSALEIIMRSLGLKGVEIIVPTNTFFATPAAVIHSGNKVVFADCDSSLCVNYNTVKKQITSNTKAVIVVHIGGVVAPEIERIKELCDSENLFLFEDASHAHGSILNGRKAGTFGDAAAFSFFATKVMTSAEGGMILTNRKEIYDNSIVLRDQGKVVGNEIHTYLGYNWRMSELHSAIGLSQLERLDKLIRLRAELARLYDEKLQDVANISPLNVDECNKSNYYKYVCFLDGVSREHLKEIMKKKHDISLAGEVYGMPCHLQPVFKSLGYSVGDFPVAENLCGNHICLPIYPTLRPEEADYVVGSLSEELR